MSQIMGLPADDLFRDCKDRTVWEKGRYAGYQAAINDVLLLVKGHMVDDMLADVVKAALLEEEG